VSADELRSEALKLQALFAGCSQLSHGLGTDLTNPDGSLQRSEKNKVISDVVHDPGPATEQMFADHLAGKRRLGLIPATPEGMTRTGVIDFDRYDAPLKGYATWADYYREQCNRLHLPLNATSSRSGGVHLIAFFEQPVPTTQVRDWLQRVTVLLLGLPKETEIFPKQEQASDSKWGHFFFLPWWGEGKVPDNLIWAPPPPPLPPAVQAQFTQREKGDRAYGIPLRKGWDPETELKKAKLEFTKDIAADGKIYFNYYVAMGKCLVKDGEHEGNRNNERCSAFVYDPKANLLYHSCFSCQDRTDKPKTRTALERLGIRLGDVIDVRADFSDQALIESWVHSAKGEVLYLADDRSWFGYGEGIWRESPCGPLYEIGEFLKDRSPGLPSSSKKELAQLHKHLCSERLASALVRLAKGRPELQAEYKDFDPDPWILGLPGGLVLDLRTAQTRQARPDDLITKTLTVAPGGQCPRWLQYLEEAQPDPEVRDYLQRLMGYCLTAETREQCVVFFIGVAGSGKNTFLHPFELLLGPYYTSLGLSALLESTDEYQRLTMLASVVGVRLASIQETPLKKGFDANTLKAMTGSGKLTARRMYHHPFAFTPSFKPLILANAPPKLNHVDEALTQRVHVVSFQQRFRGTQKEDKDLMKKLELELPGILAWAIEGCRKWQETGLKPPPAVLAATKEYIAEADTMEVWLQENTGELDQKAFTPTKILFEHWSRYCYDRGEDPGDLRAFHASLKEKRPKLIPHLAQEKELVKKYGRVRGFFGICLNPQQQELHL
jgi:putative DNA primase/helicase